MIEIEKDLIKVEEKGKFVKIGFVRSRDMTQTVSGK